MYHLLYVGRTPYNISCHAYLTVIYFLCFYLKSSLFYFNFWNLLWTSDSKLWFCFTFFPFLPFYLLVSLDSDKQSRKSWQCCSVLNVFFSIFTFKTLSLIFSIFSIMSLGLVFFVFIWLWGFWESWICGFRLFLTKLENIQTYFSSDIFLFLPPTHLFFQMLLNIILYISNDLFIIFPFSFSMWLILSSYHCYTIK